MDDNDPTDTLEALGRRAIDLMSAAKGPLRRLVVRSGECAVELEWPDSTAATAGPAEPAAQVPRAATRAEPVLLPELVEEAMDDALHYITSEIVGTFYACSEPGRPPFVAPGDMVKAGQQVAILEAMKLMTPVLAARPGRVAQVLVPDGEPVEYGARLIVLES